MQKPFFIFKNFPKRKLQIPLLGGIFSICFFLGATRSSNAQSNLKSLTTQFDNIVGEKNLAINNGPYNLRDYPNVVENKTKYFLNRGYSKGSIIYNGQAYYGVSLKYDLHKDMLIYNPENASASFGCNLIKHKVDSFSILDKKFVNLNKLEYWPKNSDMEGYSQKVEIDENLILYIKFRKKKSEIIRDDKIYYLYRPDYAFMLYYRGDYKEISSEKDVIALFPEYSKKIENYFEREQDSTPALFYQDLVIYIHNLLKN